MIIARIRSGLGNQLFQYAMSRALALRTGHELRLDLSAFEQRGVRFYRHYGLDHFRTVGEVASPQEVGQYRCRRGMVRGGFYYYLERIRPFYDKVFVRERQSYQFDATVAGMTITDKVYLSGYWQSPMYFADAADAIREEFELKHPPTGRNRELAETVKHCPSVSVHVRRGDYIMDAKVRARRSPDSLAYYYDAISLVREREPKLQLFMFSDDIAWVRQNLKIDCPVTYVDCNSAETAHEDLRLMRLCKHNIIANSSFSWWGAWLNRNPDKVVVAPQKWLNDRSDTVSGLIPQEWILA